MHKANKFANLATQVLWDPALKAPGTFVRHQITAKTPLDLTTSCLFQLDTPPSESLARGKAIKPNPATGGGRLR